MITSGLDLGFTLKPNCLLTRRPLVFLTPPRSIFFYKNSWAFIRRILFEHGYKADLYQLPFQNIQLQKNKLESQSLYLEKKHLFIDCVTYKNLKPQLLKIKNSTLTVIGLDPIDFKNNPTCFLFKPFGSVFSPTYWLHQKWYQIRGLKTPAYSETLSFCNQDCWYEFLNHCIHLAEIDFQQD